MSSNEVDVKWLERKMAEAGIRSRAELGRRIGFDNRSYMTLIFNGKRNLNEEAIFKMAKALHVPVRDLAQKLGGRSSKMVEAIKETDKNSLLVKGTIDDRFAVTFYPDGHAIKRTKIDIQTGVGAYALLYDTSNSSASMFDGSYAIILEKRDVDPAAMLDRNNLIWLADGKILLRRVTKGQLPGHYNLDGANTAPLYDQKIIAFAPVQVLLLPSSE